MKQKVNKKYKPLFVDNKRYFILMGGRGAGRSYVASQYIVSQLIQPTYFRCAIMRYVLSDVRNSIFQEILDRLEENGLENKINISPNVMSFKYGSNSIQGIGFKKSSSDQKSKLKSLANFNCVVIEEADEVGEEDFMQLDDSLRTLKSDIKVILLLNPPSKNHWIIRRWFNLVDSEQEGFYKVSLKESVSHNTCFISTTYLDNLANINESSRTNFENYKHTRPDHYFNMIKGFVSEGARGRIYKNWKIISDKEYDELEYPETYGLDFGFSNHPTAFVGIKKHNNNVWVREYIYETGLLNTSIATRLEQLGVSRDAIIYADSAEPKSIRELQLLGWNILPAEKGQDSLTVGIDMMLSKNVFYTESSTNINTEVQEFRWALDRNKEPTNEPIDEFDHAMDAIRYNVFTSSNQPFIGVA